jgi:hypothetical protein
MPNTRDPMIVFEVYRNGKRVCRAGRDTMSVLSAILSWAGTPPGVGSHDIDEERISDLHFSVAGLETTRRGTYRHPKWIQEWNLHPGDTVEIRIKESRKADPPVTIARDVRRQAQARKRPRARAASGRASGRGRKAKGRDA